MLAAIHPASGPLRAEIVDDGHAWNRLVLELPDAALEQSWEWGEAMRASHAIPHRIAILDADRGIAAASVFAWRPPLLGLSALYACRGPLIDAEHDEAWPALVAAIRALAARTRAVFLRVSPGALAPHPRLHEALVTHGFVALPEEWTIWNAPKIVMLLPLDGDEHDVWSRVSNSRRREVRKAEAAGITIETVASLDDVAALYRLLVETGQRKRLPVRRARHFEALWRQYGRADSGLVVVARHGNEQLGSLFGARFGRRAYFLYSAVDRGGAAPGVPPAGPLLYWHFIRWAKRAGCDMIHWGGSGTRLPPRQSDGGYGLYQFKRSFGATCVAHLGYYDLVFRPRFYRAFRALERRFAGSAWRLRARLNR